MEENDWDEYSDQLGHPYLTETNTSPSVPPWGWLFQEKDD